MNNDIDFFLGILAGEGSVGIRYKDLMDRTEAEPFVTINMKNERELLDDINSVIGLGNTFGKKNNMYTWQIWSMPQSKEFIKIVDNNMTRQFKLSNKYESYERWKECVYFIDEGKHLTAEGLEKLKEMSAQINDEHFTTKEELMDRYYREPVMDLTQLSTGDSE